MDFLDPKKKRAYHIRLMVGYVLVAIVIGLGSLILVYAASGYGINTKTGQIVQNGLLFVDSEPGGAKVLLNGKDNNITTSARLVLASGDYKLDIQKDGYRSWSRRFTLYEQSIARFVYPFLFPAKPLTTNLKSYQSRPAFITQSPDRKWLLVENNNASGKTVVFDQIDTTTLDKDSPAETQVSIPEGLLSNYSTSSVLTEVEWSTDNKNVLLKHDYPGGSEYVVFNRDRPDQSFNVNTLLGISPSQIALFNKKVDQLYIYNQSDKTLRLADIGKKQLRPVLLRNVLAFKPYAKDIITFITDEGEPSGEVQAEIWDNGRKYKLDEFTTGAHYLIDAAQYQGDFYYVVGSDTAVSINIYKNPEDNIRDPSIGTAIPTIGLHLQGVTKLKFSENTRFIGAESGQNFGVYDLETQNVYHYTLSDPLTTEMSWMDGHRFLGQSGGNVFVMDYDGINKQSLTPTTLANGGFFSQDYRHLLTTTTASDGSVVVQDVDMRAGADLPKNKQAPTQ
jgi:hypothetical protein